MTAPARAPHQVQPFTPPEADPVIQKTSKTSEIVETVPVKTPDVFRQEVRLRIVAGL